MTSEYEEHQEYMEKARETGDMLWRYHQEKLENARNTMIESKEAWEKRKEFLLSPLRKRK